MKKFTTKQGYIAYACTALENTYLGGMGICDDCGEVALNGFLVPVLNHYIAAGSIRKIFRSKPELPRIMNIEFPWTTKILHIRRNKLWQTH